MITLPSQQYGTAEAEIMTEGETHRGRERGNGECRTRTRLTTRKLSSQSKELENGENRDGGMRDKKMQEGNREFFFYMVPRQGCEQNTHSFCLFRSHTHSYRQIYAQQGTARKKGGAECVRGIKKKRGKQRGCLEQQMERSKCLLWPMALILCVRVCSFFPNSENK